MNIRLQDMVKRFGTLEAVSHVSLDIRDGELFTLLGPSGCGKTTILRLIGGFHKPDHGEIYFEGKPVSPLAPYERNIGMVFQNYALWPHMTIFENVAYGLRLQKVPAAEIRRRVLKVLERVEIGNLADVETRKPAALSGGQQQRVALARALVVEPKVLLMDEPLSNLDAKVRQRLRAELRRLQRQVGITAIYVTHDQEEALALADTVVLMDQGRIVQVGTPQEIYLRPSTAFAAEFLGVSNQLEAEAGEGRLLIAGQSIPYAGPVRGKAILIVRAADIQLEEPSGSPRSGTVALSGTLEESLFLGAHYRHYIRLGETLVMADSPDPRRAGPVRLAMLPEKLQIYG
jgi:ABC-type Fe3+/spermidine/putrescine transport system ATPase subunit